MTPPVATWAVRAWLDLMELAPAGVDEFVAGAAVSRPARVFGGQLLAQGLRAAGLTVAGAGLQPAALHAQFVRAGRADGELCYRVERVHDGRSTAWRAVVASQDGQTVCRLEASFCRPGRGVDFHGGALPPVPAPEPPVPGPLAYDLSWSVLPRVVELRRVPRPTPDSVPVAAAWLRAADRLPDDPLVHATLLAWASDLTASDCVTQFYGAVPGDGAVAVASLDHHLWFHRSVRADDWLLLDQRSEIAAAGRALTTGAIYAENGDRIASLTQLALARPSKGALR